MVLLAAPACLAVKGGRVEAQQRVRMLKTAAGPGGVWVAGSVRELPTAEVAALIAAGAAEPFTATASAAHGDEDARDTEWTTVEVWRPPAWASAGMWRQ